MAEGAGPVWTTADQRRFGSKSGRTTPLFKELCRAFHSRDRAMLCALSHGQVSIDGYIIRQHHLGRWTVEQLRGRYARLCGQQAQLFGSTPVARLAGSGDTNG